MADQEGLKTLLDALREHDIPLGKDDVQWAFESSKTSSNMTAWVQEYLTTNTLLSKEELQLYEAISSTPASRLNAPARPILDNELRSALRALDRSTAAIEKQSQLLEAQARSYRALSETVIELSGKEKRYKDIKSDREIGRLNGDVEEIFESIKEQLERLQKQVKTSTTSLVSTTGERLTSDDQRLEAISKVFPRLDHTQNASTDTKAIHKWTEALVSFRENEIKCTVDHQFQEELINPTSTVSGDAVSLQSEKEALKQELETLHAEISSVLSMVVEHELKTPILREMGQANTSHSQLRTQWLEYIFSTMEYMAARLETINRHAQDLSGLHRAVDEITTALEDVTAGPSQSNQAGSMKTHPRTVTKTTRSVATEGPHVSMLRELNLHPTGEAEGISEEDLQTTHLERDVELRGHEKASLPLTTQSLIDVLGNSDKTLAQLLNGLYSTTPFNNVQMSDQAQESKVNNLESDVEDLGKRIASLDAPATPDEIAKRDAFVSKWA